MISCAEYTLEEFEQRYQKIRRVYEEKSVNKNFYDNSWLVSI